MKKLFAVILLIMLSVSLFACEKENVTDDFVPVDKEITVMSFNIRTLDVLGAGDTGYKSWDARKEDAVALVLRHQPDIIGFQELKNVQYEYLKKNLPGYDCYGKNGWDNGNPDEAIFIELLGGTNAIFYKTERFEFVDGETKWLSETPDVRSTSWDAKPTDYRTYGKVTLKDKLNGKTFTYINTHVTYDGQETVRNSCEILSALAAGIAAPVIITGDFNFQQDTENYQRMVSGVLKDACVLAPDSDTGGTFHRFEGPGHEPWPKPIDFIFITDQYYSAASHRIIRDANEEGRYPSDHYPIKAVITYR